MYKVGDEEFDALVEAAMEGLPAKFASAIDNVAFAVADEPDEEELEIGAEYGTCEEESGELLGLYDGTPITERGIDYGDAAFDLPDVITVYKGPHERCCDSAEELAEEVRKTVVHEVGHYFGLTDDELYAMGY